MSGPGNVGGGGGWNAVKNFFGMGGTAPAHGTAPTTGPAPAPQPSTAPNPHAHTPASTTLHANTALQGNHTNPALVHNAMQGVHAQMQNIQSMYQNLLSNPDQTNAQASEFAQMASQLQTQLGMKGQLASIMTAANSTQMQMNANAQAEVEQGTKQADTRTKRAAAAQDRMGGI